MYMPELESFPICIPIVEPLLVAHYELPKKKVLAHSEKVIDLATYLVHE